MSLTFMEFLSNGSSAMRLSGTGISVGVTTFHTVKGILSSVISSRFSLVWFLHVFEDNGDNCFTTLLVHIWFHFSVISYMTWKTLITYEGFFTFLIFKELPCSKFTFMSLIILIISEDFSTLLTCIGFLFVVIFFLTKRSETTECFTTLSTFRSFFSSGGSFTYLKWSWRTKGFPPFLTFIDFFSVVISFMFVKTLEITEGTHTYIIII